MDPEAASVPRVEDVLVRPTRAEDAEAIWHLRRTPSSLAWTLAMPSVRPESIRDRLASSGPDDHTFVAEVGGSVVGMAGLHVGRDKRRHTGEIGMMVRDDLHGRGIGRRLLDALLDVADNDLGLARVELEVLADNARAIRLYERAGFEHEGRKRLAVFRQGRLADTLIMARFRPLPA